MTPISEPIRITDNMTEAELVAIGKQYPKAKVVVLLVEGEKYPERELNAADIYCCKGINGQIRFLA